MLSYKLTEFPKVKLLDVVLVLDLPPLDTVHVPRDRLRGPQQPEHVEALLAQRRQGRRQQQWVQFMNLSPLSEAYYQALEQRLADAITDFKAKFA